MVATVFSSELFNPLNLLFHVFLTASRVLETLTDTHFLFLSILDIISLY